MEMSGWSEGNGLDILLGREIALLVYETKRLELAVKRAIASEGKNGVYKIYDNGDWFRNAIAASFSL